MSIIRATDLQFAYPGQPVLLQGINLEIGEGESVLLKGETGSGKSTLIDLILGLRQPLSGSIELDGQAVGSLVASEYRKLWIGRQNAPGNLFGLTPRHDLEIWQIAHPDRLQGLDYDALAGPLAKLWDSPFGSLSSGELRAFSQILLPLFMDKFWLLDEPTASLDAARKEEFVRLCRQKRDSNPGLMIVSHDPILPPDLFDRVLLLENGSLREVRQ